MKKTLLLLALLCLLSPATPFNPPAAAAENETTDGFSLANRYQDSDITLSDYWMSEKYDGARALWDGTALISRGGKRYAAPAWFTSGLPAQTLDGELWLAHNRFADTMSIIRRATPHDGWKNIRYLVFDLPQHNGAFKDRYAALQTLHAASENPYWRIVEQHPIPSQQALDSKLAAVLSAGGEGVMLRRIDSTHRSGRNDDLLKYKQHDDAEGIVVGYTDGKGKYAGLVGALLVQTSATLTIKIGSGLTDDDRRNPPPLGTTITYKYQGLTKHGKPRFPVFWRIREDAPQ